MLMKILIDKDRGEKAAELAAFLCRLTPDRIKEITELMKSFNDKGLLINIEILKSDRSRPQENYYRKWCSEFAKYCGLTPDEMHEEMLMLTFGEETIDTMFGPKRRPIKRSGETSKQTYSDLIDNLIRKSAEMGYEIPIHIAYKNALHLAQEKWGMTEDEA